MVVETFQSGPNQYE